jgi:hypothetical protein
MRAYLSNLSPAAWAVIGLPALIVCHSVVTIVLPWIVRAVVPEIVRAVFSVI